MCGNQRHVICFPPTAPFSQEVASIGAPTEVAVERILAPHLVSRICWRMVLTYSKLSKQQMS